MLELFLTIGAMSIMKKIADMEMLNGWAWAGITFLLCVVSKVLIPLLFINIVIGAVATYIVMFFYLGSRHGKRK